jgi:hypothetical protein
MGHFPPDGGGVEAAIGAIDFGDAPSTADDPKGTGGMGGGVALDEIRADGFIGVDEDEDASLGAADTIVARAGEPETGVGLPDVTDVEGWESPDFVLDFGAGAVVTDKDFKGRSILLEGETFEQNREVPPLIVCRDDDADIRH